MMLPLKFKDDRKSVIKSIQSIKKSSKEPGTGYCGNKTTSSEGF